MPGSTFGQLFKLTTFGESHGKAIGGIVDGCPAGLDLNLIEVQKDLDRRKPGQSEITTERKESDKVEFLSGIINGKTIGTPIGFVVPNQDQKSEDYKELKDVYRPSHADYTYDAKYGIRDHRGGGRSSARETTCRVVAGAIAKQLLKATGIKITAFVTSIGEIAISKPYNDLDLSVAESNTVRCPDPLTAESMVNQILAAKKEGDSLGGIVQCVATGVPAGIGEPVFDKLHADLGKAMLSINAVKGFEIGSGFAGSKMKGSSHNDSFVEVEGEVSTASNNSGGIQGGISNGQDIFFNVAFKPTATVSKKQSTLNTDLEAVDLEATGRHDPCVVPRAVPIVEAMAALVLADHLLRSRTNKLS